MFQRPTENKVRVMELATVIKIVMASASKVAVTYAIAWGEVFRLLREHITSVEHQRDKGLKDAKEVKTLKKALKDLQVDFEKLQAKYREKEEKLTEMKKDMEQAAMEKKSVKEELAKAEKLGRLRRLR